MDITIPFSLQSSTDGSYVGGKTYPTNITVVIAVHDSNGYTTDTPSSLTVTERGSLTGDYNLTATLGQEYTEYDYIRVEISCTGCIPKRFTLYPDTAIDTSSITTALTAIQAKTDNLPSSPAATSDIPTVNAIWGRTGADTTSRTLTTTIPSADDIAEAVLTTDTGSLTVDNNEYTVTHLIMASQNSIVESNNNQHLWKIRQGNTIIATRELTLNENGAIVQTE